MRSPILKLFSGNLISKFLGLVREVLTAYLFGTGSVVGAFRVAQTGTLVPVNFFTSDALNSAFIPQYKKIYNDCTSKAQLFLWVILILFAVLSVLLGATLWISAGPWVGFLAPGLEPETGLLAIAMLQIMALGIPFYLMSSLLMFLGMANDDFSPMAIRPVLQNFGLIIGALMAYVFHDVLYLAWGFTASYIAFAFWVISRCLRFGLLALPEVWYWPQAGEVLKGFWRTLRPLLLLPVMLQGNIVIERAVASLVGLAVISALDYARFVSETLILFVSVPVAFAGLAQWSGLGRIEVRKRLHEILVVMLLVAVPASLFIAAHAHLIVEAIYLRGAFDAESMKVTGDVLFGMSLGLWAQVIGYVLIKALNAQMLNAIVVWIMAAALLSNAVLNLTMHPFLGALTLGLGNAAYGLVLLFGTLTALGLWKQAFSAGWVLALGAIGYISFHNLVPDLQFAWFDLAINGVLALAYWMIFFLVVPKFRHIILALMFPKKGI